MMTLAQLRELGDESLKREQLVDEFLDCKRQQKAAEAATDAASARLQALGCGVHNGTTGSATISQVAGRKTTDWKTLAATVGISAEVIEKFTKIGEASIRITTGEIK